MPAHAYALREEYEETFEGGTLAHGAKSETVDIKALLDEGAGVILTDDAFIQQYLDESPIFKRVAAKDAEAPAVGEGGEVHVLDLIDPTKAKPTKEELLDIADDELGDGHGLDDTDTKADIAEAINDGRRERAEGGE